MRYLGLGFVCVFTAMANVSALGQTVTYELGPETALLDAAFYAGEAIDGSDVGGRQVIFFGISNDGRKVAFHAINIAAGFANGLFVADVGVPDSWRRISADTPFTTGTVSWTPDDSRVIIGNRLISVATGADVYDFEVATDLPGDTGPFSVTRLASNNWAAAVVDGSRDVLLVPIKTNGERDPNRDPVLVTNLNLSGGGMPGISQPQFSPDGTKLAVSIYTNQEPADSVEDISDVYVIDDLQSIIAAPKLPDGVTSSEAPTTLADMRVIDIRATETANFVHGMRFSQDNSLVFVNEDYNNVFNDNDFFDDLLISDFDLVVTKSDGTGTDFRIVQPGNQGQINASPGGTRVLYVRDVAPGIVHLFAATLTVKTTVTGTPMGDPMDNIVETTTDQMVADASGTSMDVPTGTTIDFPDSAAQEITIVTPIDPVSEPQLPDDPFISAIPVVREFGPEGTTFDPPITVTITYTDAEVLGMDESSLRPYLFNEDTGIFDIPVPEADVVSRDLATNTISFRVDHFSTYGLGGTLTSTLPIGEAALLILFALLTAGAAFALRTRRVGEPARRMP